MPDLIIKVIQHHLDVGKKDFKDLFVGLWVLYNFVNLGLLQVVVEKFAVVRLKPLSEHRLLFDELSLNFEFLNFLEFDVDWVLSLLGVDH